MGLIRELIREIFGSIFSVFLHYQNNKSLFFSIELVRNCKCVYKVNFYTVSLSSIKKILPK